MIFPPRRNKMYVITCKRRYLIIIDGSKSRFLVLRNIWHAQSVCNATSWSLDRFPYGMILRMAHAAQSVKHCDATGLARNYLDPSDPIVSLAQDSVIQSNTAHAYFYDVQKDLYRDGGETQKVVHDPTGDGRECNARYGRLACVWKRFARLICGKEGPFSRGWVRGKPDQVAKICHSLRHGGPPRNGDKWRSPVVYPTEDFAMARSFLAILIFT